MRRAREIATNAELVTDVGRRLVELAGVEPGMDVLDVACGKGNAAIPAAQAGARQPGSTSGPTCWRWRGSVPRRRELRSRRVRLRG